MPSQTSHTSSLVPAVVCCLAVDALRGRLAAYPDIRARHAFLSASTAPSHQTTLTRLQQVLDTLHASSDAEPSRTAQQPLSYSGLQAQLAAYHSSQRSQQRLSTQQAALDSQLSTLASYLSAADAISHREAGADGALSPVGSVHPSALVAQLARVSDAVDGVGERCNAVLGDEEQVRRMKQAGKDRQWSEAAVMRAMLTRPDELRQAKTELRRRLGEEDGA